MYRWKLVFTLDNGKVIEGIYEGKEYNSGDVAKVVFGKCSRENSYFGFGDMTRTHNIYVHLGNVVVLDISEYKP